MADSTVEWGSIYNVVDHLKGALVTLPKWKSALLVGSPVLMFAGYVYVKRRLNGDATSKSLLAAISAKEGGNEELKCGRSKEAIALYTRAIKACPPDRQLEIAKMFQNRALAHELQGATDRVIADCDAAIKADPRYVRAVARRCKALEKKGNLAASLEDATFVCLLENFKKNESLETVDRLLKLLGKNRASERFSTPRRLVTPSPHFLRTYLASFVRDPIFGRQTFDDVHDQDLDNGPFLKARRCVLERRDLDNVVPLCDREIASGVSKYTREAELLKATFLYLGGAGKDAGMMLDRLLEDEGGACHSTDFTINVLIKRASVHLQCGRHEEASEDFEVAQRLDPDHPDVYHHRGQLRLSLDEIAAATEDFETCAGLASDFPVARFHGCYARYRRETSRDDLDSSARDASTVRRVAAAADDFEEALRRFPDCAEGWALYAQVMVDGGEFSKADEMYRRALEIEPDNGNIQVHRGLCNLQWNFDPADPERAIASSFPYFSTALEADPTCEFALETLGTLEVQRGGLDLAVQYFDAAIELAKTEAEMAHLFSLKEAAVAQRRAADRLKNLE